LRGSIHDRDFPSEAPPMRLTIDAAASLARQALAALGYDADEASLIADHLLDCDLRGLPYGGLARIISIGERLARIGDRRAPMRIVRETPVSAQIDGGDQIGYLVAHRATRIAIDKAKAAGIAIVGANETWYTGMLSYYAEMMAADGLVSMMASNTSAWVAPHGASEGRFGTNPMCFGFPGTADPVIWDVGTSAIIHADVTMHKRLGLPLPEGVAFDPQGRATRDPAAALAGAFAAWGGAKGSGLGLVVQLLGTLAGSPPIPPELENFGFLVLAISPSLLSSEEEFRSQVTQYAQAVRAARPVEGGAGARMPFDRSLAERRRRLADGAIEIAEPIHAALVNLVGSAARRI
jgi:LDH2 family malate/lactate/ureidoglycolate dehydrogenase